ncbi:CAP domain-containing protein [Futiania mangrovi]|uniref:CAP domain-containing protein n=1 Tax=Futiania mangrovi TaxID=2959716 RepID=A0A9J6PMY1_9PROT|nr:CAP domain-containing protein [Futiania mangrovii]MCP1337426.1 CAP domain-containing protein [Futiania mangrovii]
MSVIQKTFIAGALVLSVLSLGSGDAGARPSEIPVASPAHCAQPAVDPALAQAVVDEINAYRAAQGLGPVHLEPRLTAAAMMHVADLAQRSVLSHYGAQGETFVDRIEKVGYSGYARAENVGWNYATPAGIVRGWIESPSHRRNMELADVTEAGIGYVCDPDRGHFWALNLGTDNLRMVQRVSSRIGRPAWRR